MPLIFAGIHLAFAFPFISKILALFAMDNILLTAIVNLICFAVFGLFYALVYKITSSSYYTIVSGTFCTLLLKNDYSPKAVSRMMGHAKEIIDENLKIAG